MSFALDPSAEEQAIHAIQYSKQSGSDTLNSAEIELEDNLYIDQDFNPQTAPIKLASDQAFDTIPWYRPQVYADSPEYFKSVTGCGVLRTGALNDAWFLGVLAAITVHPSNLIENLFASESLDDFKTYGIFTCRFYKDTHWVYITTDTRIPYNCTLEDLEHPTEGHVLCGSSVDKNELYIPFIEKAYAKLHGSYQSLHAVESFKIQGNSHPSFNVSARILEAFIDLTGGSGYRIDLHDERLRALDPNYIALWKKLQQLVEKQAIITAQLKQQINPATASNFEETSLGILKNRQYIVDYIKEIKPQDNAETDMLDPKSTLRFVKLKNVWGRGRWKGDWGENNSKWDDYLHVEMLFRNDAKCDFNNSRTGQNGSFWMIWEDFIQVFTEIFCIHVFLDQEDLYQYVIPGEWHGPSAAGRPSKSLADTIARQAVSNKEGKSKKQAAEIQIEKTKWHYVTTPFEPNWYRNPQFRLRVAQKTADVYISLLQRDCRLYGGDHTAINFVLLKLRPDKNGILFEYDSNSVVAKAHSYDSCALLLAPSYPATEPTATSPVAQSKVVAASMPNRLSSDREIVREFIVLESGFSYYLIPYTDNPKVEMEFFFRIFALKSILIDRVSPLQTVVQNGRWRFSDDLNADDSTSAVIRTAGGPLFNSVTSLLPDSEVQNARDESDGTRKYAMKENLSWCQNPQYWVYAKQRLAQEQMHKATHVTLKIVLRKAASKGGPGLKDRQTRNLYAMNKGSEGKLMADTSNFTGITIVRVNTSPLAADDGDCATDNEPTTLLTKSKVAAGAPALVQFKRKTGITRNRLVPPKNNSPMLRVIRSQRNQPRTNFLGEVIKKSSSIRSTKALIKTVPKSLTNIYNLDFAQDESMEDIDNTNTSVSFPAPKLNVKPQEWCRISNYFSPVWSCLFLYKVPLTWLFPCAGLVMSDNAASKALATPTGGLLVIPSLGASQMEGDFELQIDADMPLSCQVIPQNIYKNLIGEWTISNAMGCHLNSADWLKNPKFYLKINGLRPARLRITLSRSELEWKAKCKRNAVGNMIGFYLFPSPKKLVRACELSKTFAKSKEISSIHVNGKPWSETDFLPLHTVTTPPELTLRPTVTDPYVIMPSTYEPEKLGKFILSVQCDVDFQLVSEMMFTHG